MNYYELLEISPSASVEIVRNAYKTLAKKYHPDTYRGDTTFAEEKMKLLNEAISVLENEDKRREYNKINGINPLSKSGYAENGKNNMLNTDENGESIFFSYDMDGAEESAVSDSGASYMDIIDNFINNSRPEKKQRKKAKKNKDGGGIDAEDISKINIARPVKSDTEFSYENTDNAEEDGGYDFKTFNLREKSRKKAKKNKAAFNNLKIYYIVVSFLITAIILLFVLIMQSVDFNNIKNLLSGLSGNSDGQKQDSTEDVGNFGFEDEPTDVPEPTSTEIETSAEIAAEYSGSVKTAEETTSATEVKTSLNAVKNPVPTTSPATAKPAETRPPVATQPETTDAEPVPAVTEPPIEPVTEEFSEEEVTAETVYTEYEFTDVPEETVPADEPETEPPVPEPTEEFSAPFIPDELT